ASFEREATGTLGQRIAVAYAGGESSAAAVIGEVESGVDLSRMMQELPAVEDLLEAADDAPIIRMLNALLTQAAKDGASDIHIEPYEAECKARLADRRRSADAPSASHRPPQQPHGIVLVPGPPGSAKTTPLYASLGRVDTSTTNVLTVEDPVEYELPGIGQTQVNPKIDLTFAKSLRAILRQDPDVIMIGEIRDFETAQIAIQASLTGPLVLATLHTNDAPSA